MRLMTSPLSIPVVAMLLTTPFGVSAQAPAPTSASSTTAPRQSGTVKAVTPQDFVLTNAAGQDFAVNLAAGTRVLLVDPVTHDLKTARTGSVADIAGGDKAIVSGTSGDTGQTLTATRVLLLKSGAIAAMHASEQAAWAHSVGGVVRSVDIPAGTVTIANGQRTTVINTSPTTIVRRYTGGSVRFEDAVSSTLGVIQPGDQVQARGQRSPDTNTVAADEIVDGSFSNFSGLLTAVDASGGTVTLKDLATKKTVTVAVSAQTNLRRLPAGFGAGAGTMAGGSGAPESGSAAPAGESRPGAGAGGRVTSAAPGDAKGGNGRAGRVDLARVIGRLPTESLSDLKPGEAVMIVASNTAGAAEPTAVTMVSGVEQILSSSAAGQTTLSPWSLGGSEAEGAGEAGGGGR